MVKKIIWYNNKWVLGTLAFATIFSLAIRRNVKKMDFIEEE